MELPVVAAPEEDELDDPVVAATPLDEDVLAPLEAPALLAPEAAAGVPLPVVPPDDSAMELTDPDELLTVPSRGRFGVPAASVAPVVPNAVVPQIRPPVLDEPVVAAADPDDDELDPCEAVDTDEGPVVVLPELDEATAAGPEPEPELDEVVAAEPELEEVVVAEDDVLVVVALLTVVAPVLLEVCVECPELALDAEVPAAELAVPVPVAVVPVPELAFPLATPDEVWPLDGLADDEAPLAAVESEAVDEVGGLEVAPVLAACAWQTFATHT